MLRPFWLALALMTRFPVPDLGEIRPGEQARSMLWYPVVGLVLGLVLVLMAWILRSADNQVVSALLVMIWVLMTGALHLDGLADSADAWLGSHGNKERALEIMKDPACGPAGVVAIVSVLMLKLAALQALLDDGAYLVLLLVPVLARTIPPILFLTTDYLREQGMASEMVGELGKQPAIPVMTAVFVLAAVVAGGQGIGLVLTVAAVFLLLRWIIMQWLGGTTGDTAGALVEIAETAALLVAAISVGSGV